MRGDEALTAGLVAVLGVGLLLHQTNPRPQALTRQSSAASLFNSKPESCTRLCSVTGRVDLEREMVPLGGTVGMETRVDVACAPGLPLGLGEAEIVLLVDYSHSMIDGADYLSLAKAAVQELLRGLVPGQHRLAAIAFKSVPQILSLLSGSFNDIQAKVEALTPHTEFASTSLYRALERVPYVLGDDGRPDAPVLLLLLTDGETGDRDPIPLAEELRSDDIRIYASGFGVNKVGLDLLRRVAGHDDHFFHVKDLAGVQEAVRRILARPPESELVDLELSIVGSQDLPIIPKSATPTATEPPNGLVWRWSVARAGELSVAHRIRTITPGIFPSARSVSVSYEACPGNPRTVDLALPELLVLAPTLPPEPTPTTQPATISATPSPIVSATLPPTVPIQATATRTQFLPRLAILPSLFRRPPMRR